MILWSTNVNEGSADLLPKFPHPRAGATLSRAAIRHVLNKRGLNKSGKSGSVWRSHEDRQNPPKVGIH